MDVRSAIAVWDVEEVRSLLGCGSAIAVWGCEGVIAFWGVGVRSLLGCGGAIAFWGCGESRTNHLYFHELNNGLPPIKY